MVIGILCESEYDFEALVVIVRRFLADVVVIEKFVPYSADGPIIGKLDAASTRFFKGYSTSLDKVDLAIYFSDLDGSELKKPQITHWISAHAKKYPERIIVPVFAEPHFEQWFLAETDCLRSVMPDLPQNIPYDDLPPKRRLKKLGQKFTDTTLSTEDVVIQLAETVNLNSLKIREPEFKCFCNELTTAVRMVQTRTIE